MRLALGDYASAADARLRALSSEGAAARIWNRDAAFWGGDDGRRASVENRLGWLDVASWTRERAAELSSFRERALADGFRDAVVLGMGGSSLAPEVMRQAFGHAAGGLRLHVLDTTDPATIRAITDEIDVTRTVFFVSSKSGTTIEALCLFAYFHDLVSKQKPDRSGDNFVAVTDAGTPLEALAGEHGFRHVFTNPGDIGGRYSALSYFGMAPAAAAGFDVVRLLDRGIEAAAVAHTIDGDAMRLGAALGELALAGRDKCTFVISPRIASFGLWVEQLIAESTGKLGRGIVPVVGEPPGTPAHYGADRLFVQIRLDADANAENDAFVAALEAAGQPVIVIELADAYDLGGAFFMWEFAVAVAGRVLDINPFDEPNVQESKDNTNRVLAEFEASGHLDPAGLDVRAGLTVMTAPGAIATGSADDAIGGLVRAAGDGAYLAITAYVPASPGSDTHFAAMRAGVRNGTGASTTLGYGPRFLHSTGQVHKGGPLEGVFLQVTAPDALDFNIPGRSFTFGQLKRSQSIGDFQSLIAHGRPCLRVHLGADTDAGLGQLAGAVARAAESASPARR